MTAAQITDSPLLAQLVNSSSSGLGCIPTDGEAKVLEDLIHNDFNTINRLQAICQRPSKKLITELRKTKHILLSSSLSPQGKLASLICIVRPENWLVLLPCFLQYCTSHIWFIFPAFRIELHSNNSDCKITILSVCNGLR